MTPAEPDPDPASPSPLIPPEVQVLDAPLTALMKWPWGAGTWWPLTVPHQGCVLILLVPDPLLPHLGQDQSWWAQWCWSDSTGAVLSLSCRRGRVKSRRLPTRAPIHLHVTVG